MIQIREGKISDYGAIKEVNDNAFHQPQEGRIIETIRGYCIELLSLVAVVDDIFVGQIFFNPVTIENHLTLKNKIGLALMVVLPIHQKQGIGSMLINEGLDRLKKRSASFIIVL